MIRLEEINENNWHVDLHVRTDQKKDVVSAEVLLAKAYAYREHRSQARLIYRNERPVGMLMYFDDEESKAYDFDQVFVDEKYQGRGYGTAGVELALNLMRADGKYDRVLVRHRESNKIAQKMYEKFGFVLTDEGEEDEIVLQKIL